AALARDRPRGIRNANLHSATPSPQFEGFSGARRIYQSPGATRMVWKFQPPSGKDSQKRSATRHKNPQSRVEKMCSYDAYIKRVTQRLASPTIDHADQSIQKALKKAKD